MAGSEIMVPFSFFWVYLLYNTLPNDRLIATILSAHGGGIWQRSRKLGLFV